MALSHEASQARQGLLERSLAGIGPHDHACLIFDSAEEQHGANAAFVRQGLAAGDRCLCVADTGNVEEIEGGLRARGVDLDGASARRALTITTERSTYLARGRFDPEVMGGVLRDAAERAVVDGFRALRIAGEVTWALGGDLGADRIMEYEATVNALLPHVPCLALCHYDRRRFSAEVLRDVIRTHPLALVHGRLCRNFYYVPPDELVGPDRLQREVDRLLELVFEREQAEEALRASERHLALVLEGSQDGTWDWDIGADRITYSAGWARLIGLDGAGADRTWAGWRDRIHPDDRAGAVESLEAHLAGRSDAYVRESRVRFADGAWHWVLARGRVAERDAQGRPRRLAGTLTDVTERRKLQARLELSARLASVGTLAAGVAHEINNPLTFVDANLRWTVERLAQEPPGTLADVRAALGDALDGAARVRDIVQELRRFARPAQDEPGSTAEVSAELEAAVAIARRQVQARARLSVDIAPRLPPVRVSRHELGQVVVNLLVNAAQAIPEGHAGEHEVRLQACPEGAGLLLEVSDTGQGIPADVLPRIFDPFYTTKEVGAGMGLGLAICHGIVEAAGGTIAVHSEPGRGARFSIRLPAAARPARAHPPPPRPTTARRRILVVDDEPLVGRALARALSGEHDVEALTSAREALRRLAAGERWDLVVCDLMMPELGGPELAERVRACAPDAAARLVFMTGAASLEPSAAVRAAGHLCLEKPIQLAELRRLAAGE
jgi:PAS domain S-box-containing protein